MGQAPKPSFRGWIVIIALLLIFVWTPFLFVSVDAHKPFLFYRESPPSLEIGPRTEMVSVAGRELIFYYFEYQRRHVFVYFPFVVQDGPDVRRPTYSEFVALKNHLRPHNR